VDGEVTATSGKIGGFTIGASSLYNNLSSFGGTQTSGVYVGTDGIQLGQNFKVDTRGELTATNMVLLGTLWFKDGSGNWVSMNANNLRSGAQSAYSNGSYWSGGAGAGYSSQTNWNNARSYGGIDWLSCRRFTFSGSDMGKRTIHYKDHGGNNRTITVAAFQ
jgi:hypothetical protein